MTHSFIDRPIFATVLSVFLTLIGLGALFILPISQYPEIVPPTVQITTTYPGASAERCRARLRHRSSSRSTASRT
jgi:multidrug efflux pump subunit AcrB